MKPIKIALTFDEWSALARAAERDARAEKDAGTLLITARIYTRLGLNTTADAIEREAQRLIA